MGRPVYGDDIRESILSRLSAGESLNAICQTEGFPAESTVRLWDIEDQPEGFSARYARARALGIDALAERAMSVAADKQRDPNCRRVELDAIKWFSSKMRPEKYGDRLQQQFVDGKGNDVQPTFNVLVRDVAKGE